MAFVIFQVCLESSVELGDVLTNKCLAKKKALI